MKCKIEDGPDEAVPAELAEQYQTRTLFADQHPDKKEVDSEKSDSEEKEERQEELADETKPVGPVAFDQDALVKLCDSQGKRKGVDFIEFQYLKYESPLGSRYASKEMLELFSSFKRIRTWRLLRLYLARGENSLK
ncbi:Adenylosuccinate lyase [Brachionus plicatilis]|uniref:Adenylosuccinate lyase n=1 Tax=Brachionus plicatilis TaxID=10195 RepID=A0A3M7T2B6_BRAPC|nr:Adenylosuccinate lyase [Brachionus plicatilis]